MECRDNPDAVKQAFDELLVTTRPDHPLLAKALSGWVASQYGSQPEETGEMVKTLPRGPLYHAGAATLSGVLYSDGEPAAALQWAAAIGDPLRRNVMLTQTMSMWRTQLQSMRVPEVMRAEVLRLPISEAAKQRLLRKFDR